MTFRTRSLRRSRSRLRPSGFTLLEVLMVISIAVILLALLLGGTSATLSWSRGRQAHATLAQLDAIVDGYFRQTGKYFPNGSGNPTIDITSMSGFITEAQKVVGTPKDNNSTGSGDVDLITPLGKAVVYTESTSTYVVNDPWGRPILFYNPNTGGGSTLRPFFVSTGPNGINDSTGAAPWATGQAYAVGSVVILSDATWVCATAHTSSTTNGPGASSSHWTKTDDIVSAGGAQ